MFHLWKGRIIDRAGAILLYEEAYFHHLESDSDLRNWIVESFCEVYDNALTNIGSGCDYSIHEAPTVHLQDIAIRRVLLRLGLSFKGDELLQVRGVGSNGYRLNPGRLAFHIPEEIVQPNVQGCWQQDSIEDFWQSNKVLAVTARGLTEFANHSEPKPALKRLFLDPASLPDISSETRKTGSLLYSASEGLGIVKSATLETGDIEVAFRHSGRRKRYGAHGDAPFTEIKDANALLGP